MYYKVEYLTESLDEAIRIAKQVVSNVDDVPLVWLVGPNRHGIPTRNIACVERTQPSWILSVATDEERATLCAQLDPVEVMG